MTTVNGHPAKRKRGTGAGRTMNNYRHGLRSGKLPSGCSYILRQSNEFRQSLEAACLEAHGSVSIYHASLIAASTAWMRHGAKARKWAADHHEELTHELRLKYSVEEAKAYDAVALNLRRLNLDHEVTDDVAAKLYKRDVTTELAQGSTDAPQPVSADQNGQQAASVESGASGTASSEVGVSAASSDKIVSSAGDDESVADANVAYQMTEGESDG